MRDRLRIWLHPDVRGVFFTMVVGRAVLVVGVIAAGHWLWHQLV